MGGATGKEESERERGERESGEGRMGGAAGNGRGKGEKGKGRGAARKVGLGYLLFRFRMFLLYFFLDLIKLVRFGPVQSV